MPDVHLLSDPTPGFRHVTVVCGARLPERGTWDARAVTCPACLRQVPAATAHRPGSPLSEKAWLQQVRNLARARGFFTYHTYRSTHSERGWVDLVCLKPPMLLCVELKTDVGRVTAEQQQWLENLNQVTNVWAYVWRPSDWDQVVQVFSG